MRRLLFAAGVFSVVVAGHGCATSGSDNPPAMDDAGVGVEAGSPVFVVADAGEDRGTSARPAPSRHEAGCTADLRWQVDAAGNLRSECPADQGCVANGCAPACDAAAAAGGAEGCDFLLTTPSRAVGGPCQAAVITNTWRAPMTITLTRAGRTFDVTKLARVVRRDGGFAEMPPFGLLPGMTAYVFLSGYSDYGQPAAPSLPDQPTLSLYDCPFPKAIDGSTAVFSGGTAGDFDAIRSASGRSAAFHIRTSVPAIVHDMTPFAWTATPGAMSLVLPTTTWGKHYVGASPALRAGARGDIVASNVAQIVAAEDGTTFTVLSPEDMPEGPGVARAPHQTKTTYTLNAGEWIQWQGLFDFTGTRIESNRRIGVVGGSPHFGLPLSVAGGNPETTLSSFAPARNASTQTFLASLENADSEYVAVPYSGRRFVERVPYRIVGLRDGTALTYDPPLLEGASAALNAGESAVFYTYRAFTVRSQDAAHPFLLFQEAGSVSDYEFNSDSYVEEASQFVPMLALSRFRTEIVVPPVPSPSVTTDPAKASASRANVALVRRKLSEDCHRITYECGGKPVVVGGWKPIGYDGLYEFAYVDPTTRPNPADAGPPTLPCDDPQPLASTFTGDEPFGIVATMRSPFPAYGWLAYVPTFAARGASTRYREKSCTEGPR